MSKENWGSNLVFLLAGAAIGASVALLYAPQDGESTRRLIGEKAGDAKDRAVEFKSNVADSARDRWSQTSGKIQDLLHRGDNNELLTSTEHASGNGAG